MYLNTLRGQVLDHLFGLATWTAPTNLWIGLSTADPLADGSGLAEPVGGGYVRIQCDPGAARWLRTGNTVDNKAAITFPDALAGWGTITHICVFTGSVGGLPLLALALNTPRTVLPGDAPRFPIGEFNNTAQ